MFVWSVWGLMVLGGLAFVTAYGSYVPFMDDWEWVPAVTGNEPLTFSWVWAQLADHRNPLARLLLLGIYTLAGGNFRAALYANVVFFAVLAAVALWVVRRLRGRTHYADALFPLALLTLDEENAFIGLGVSFVPAMLLAGLMLLLIARRGTQVTMGTVTLAGGCLLLLTLIGTVGLTLVPPLALWLGYLGFLSWRSGLPHGRWRALLALTLAAIAVAILPLYFINFEPHKIIPPSGGLTASVVTTLEFLSLTFGPAGSHLFFAQDIPPYVGLGVVVLCLVSGWLLLRVWRARPEERPRAAGLLLFMLAVGGTAAAVGVSRSGFDPEAGHTRGYAPRYAMLTAPLLCCLYLVWDCYGRERLGRLVPLGLFLLLCLLFPFNLGDTLQAARVHQGRMATVEAAIASQETPHAIAAEYRKFLYDQTTDEQLAAYFRMLRRAGIGPFASLPDDESDRDEMPLTASAATAHAMTWADGAGKVQGADSYLLFTLPEPLSVAAVRITYQYEGASGPVAFTMYWRRAVLNDFVTAGHHARLALPAEPPERTTTVPVNQTVDEIRIHPAAVPCVFRISEIALILRGEDDPEAYDRMIAGMRAAVRATVPPDAALLVASRGDPDPVDLSGWKVDHFPRREKGGYLGHELGSGTQVIDQFKKARAAGYRYVVFPESMCWYLDLYPDAKKYLDTHGRAVHRGDACVIYELR